MLAALKFCFATLVLVLNTLALCALMVPFALAKLLLPFTPVRRLTDRVLNKIPEGWIAINSFWLSAVNRGRWQVSGLEGLRRDGWYLVTCNHQSWVDIVVIQRVLNQRIPMLKFFLKRELIYVPVLGLAWWALDFPFMRRGSGGGSARKDLRDARQACEKFRLLPTSVMSFAEGTRFTAAKHAQQASPYRHLLQPKAGGMAMALGTMGELFDGLVDVTIVYPGKVPTFLDALCGRLGDVEVLVRQQPIPAELLKANAKQRALLQAWLDGIWQYKDRAIDRLLAQHSTTPE
ncbi:acyltransferase [Rhodococcus sp. SRB_17]|nr:acyltransferase [Rhodococcus sp. SRB_17]